MDRYKRKELSKDSLYEVAILVLDCIRRGEFVSGR
jgi:hypothetical protein